MGLLEFLTPKKKAVSKTISNSDNQTEEYTLPKLERGNFCMTEELLRRKKDEELKKQYGFHSEKYGDFM